MDLVIDRSENVVSVDAATVDLDVTDFIPEHVELVIWTGTTYSGQVEYNDRPRILENFQDILPFHPVIREYLRHLPELSLAQAKRLQIEFMDAVAGSRSRIPIKFRIARLGAPNAGERNWRALDTDIARAATQGLPSVIGTKSGSGDASGIAGQVNYYGTQCHVGIETIRGTLPNYIRQTSFFVNGLFGSYVFRAAPGISYLPLYAIPWNVTAGYGGDTGDGVENGGGSWLATNPFQLIDLSLTEVGTILQEIAKRTDVLAKIFYRKTNEVLALSTMQAVIDYNADQGWPV